MCGLFALCPNTLPLDSLARNEDTQPAINISVFEMVRTKQRWRFVTNQTLWATPACLISCELSGHALNKRVLLDKTVGNQVKH